MNRIFVVVLVVMIFTPNFVFGQIEIFEQQIEKLQNPQECTTKVVQGSSAEIPFTIKVFYDVTKNSKLELIQQGTSFPITQKTPQVMIFYSNQTDQYQIYMEINYDEPKERQIYIEYLSAGQVVANEQEKFNTNKFCMTILANTILPTHIPTREELFGDLYGAISQVPALVEANNRNTLTMGASIAFMWIIVVAQIIVTVLMLIILMNASRKFNAKVETFDDMTETLSKLQHDDSFEKEIPTELPPARKQVEQYGQGFEQEFRTKMSRLSSKDISKYYDKIKRETDEKSAVERRVIITLWRMRREQQARERPKEEVKPVQVTKKQTMDERLLNDIAMSIDIVGNSTNLQQFETDDLQDAYKTLYERWENKMTETKRKTLLLISEEINDRFKPRRGT